MLIMLDLTGSQERFAGSGICLPGNLESLGSATAATTLGEQAALAKGFASDIADTWLMIWFCT